MLRKRAPGGGRKPQGDFRGSSEVLTARVRPELRGALMRLAEKHRRSLSQEMQSALDFWVGRYVRPKPHIGALTHAVALLVDGIEQKTGRRWTTDAFTGAAVRHGIEYLVFHFAPIPDGLSAVPANVEKFAASMPLRARERHRTPAGFGEDRAFALISQIENAPAEEKPLGLRFTDERGFWQILRDLGSGWERNRKSWPF